MEVLVTVKLVQDDVRQSAIGNSEFSFILDVVLVAVCRMGWRPKRFVVTFSSGVPRCATNLQLQRVLCRRLQVRQRGADGTAYPKVPAENLGPVERYPATSEHAGVRTGGQREEQRAEQTLPIPVEIHVRDRTFQRLPRGDKMCMSAENHYC